MRKAQLVSDGSGKALNVAVLGSGVVGTQVVRLLTEQRDEIAQRTGATLTITGIAVRDASAPRDAVIDRDLLTEDAASLVRDADIVIEVMGGIEPARTLLLDALGGGASIVTANKALLAAHGPELYEAADAAGVDVYYEAAVAGAIPLIRPVRESLAGDKVEKFLGIVNGTTNYILDEMTTGGLDFDTALRQAQDLGYAEADPTADVDGLDAAAKAVILASLAFHTRVPSSSVSVTGIREITADDVAQATAEGMVIKLIAVGERTDAGVVVRVHPALIPLSHPLAGVHGAFNAVFIEAEAAGELMFYGQGAGGAPTASAVLGDVVSAARNRVNGGKAPDESALANLPVLDAGQAITRIYVRLLVEDRPGVLAAISHLLAESQVSIESVRQPSTTPVEGVAELFFSTHAAVDHTLSETIARVADLDVVREVVSIMRVEGN